jgi:hypothetical protein
MLSPTELYPLVLTWLQTLAPTAHRTALPALAQLVTALLLGQSLRPSALMRALLSPQTVPARQRYKRVRRAWTRRWLSPAWLAPHLVRAARALAPADAEGVHHLALDSVRCGPWEVFTLGVVWHGRVLLVGWAVLPYPWPKRQFTPTVCALLRLVAGSWPVERRVHLVADRAFASRGLLKTLREVGWGYTLRLRALHWVTVGAHAQAVRERLATAHPDRWTATPARYGAAQARGGADSEGTLVIGRGLVVVPAWQANPGSFRHRAARQTRHVQRVGSKHPGRHSPAAVETDAWVVLFSSHPTWRAAVRSYRQRWATEGTYRDGQGGWDGQHGWDLEPTLPQLTDPTEVAAVVGLWALGTLLQSWVGDQLGQSDAPAEVQASLLQWSTTGRLSVWARGRFALTEPSGQLRPWLRQTLAAGAHRLAPVASVDPLATPTRMPLLQAA